MSMLSKLKPVPAPAETGTTRDSLRSALADAIEAFAEKRKARDAVHAGYERADGMVLDSFHALDAVEDEIKKAGAYQRDEILASVMRGDELPGNGKRADAERRKADIEARLAAAREARDGLKQQANEHDSEVASAERTLRERRDAVVFNMLPTLIEAAAPIRRELQRHVQVINFVRGLQSFYMGADDPRRVIRRDAERLSEPLLSQAGGQSIEAVSAWSAAAERLLTDPDTQLPGA